MAERGGDERELEKERMNIETLKTKCWEIGVRERREKQREEGREKRERGGQRDREREAQRGRVDKGERREGDRDKIFT